MYELMDAHVIARSTAYAIVKRVINAINKLSCLDYVWLSDDAVERAAAGFKDHSTNDILARSIGAMDGRFIRLRQPSLRYYPLPIRFNSAHKKGLGMNFQVKSAFYVKVEWVLCDYLCTACSNNLIVHTT